MEQNSMQGAAQIIYFSHGGGPLPILGDPGHKAMVDFMVALPAQLKKPDFILVISAHWEESVATLMGAQQPAMSMIIMAFRGGLRDHLPCPGKPGACQPGGCIADGQSYPGVHRRAARLRPRLVHPAQADVSPGRHPLSPALAATRLGRAGAHCPGKSAARVERHEYPGSRLGILFSQPAAFSWQSTGAPDSATIFSRTG